MAYVEQSNPREGQSEEWEETLVSIESSTDTSMEQSRTDSKPNPTEDPLQVLVDADDEQCFLEEATILNAKEVKTKGIVIEAPAIPKRNTLRTSRLLDSLKFDSIESATKSLNTTHSLYLSSEEDESSSADEYSDDDYESSSEDSEGASIRRKSQEITARIVSVIFVGKPSMVQLASGRRSVTPVKRPQSEFYGRSVSSPFGATPLRSHADYPPRKVSLTLMGDLPKKSPSFLSQDPFSNSPYTRRESVLAIDTSSTTYPRPPKTPTGAFQRIQKTINLARKRSRPNLKAAAENSASMSSLNLSTLTTSQESLNKPCTASSATTQSPASYNHMLNGTRRNSLAASAVPSTTAHSSTAHSLPASPITPVAPKRGLLSGLNMNRRRSMKIKI
ncbi:hypothetical protein GGS24DRAFT_424143 [Hypoxylon argillaceum]|nr:hypothetical protein GGS24DRAFT_424143 [Hypoxylon argillaceum]KAI1155734.1 hypothetical protein F4825DRAFT_406299 [Nemania diffusa]